MTLLAYAVLLLIAAIACAFVAWPILRQHTARGRFVLGAAAVLFVLGVGGALYVVLGHPALAARDLQGDEAKDLNALIGRLSKAVRTHPEDPRGWALLGQAYMTAHDANDGAKAFERAIAAAEALGQRYSFLYSAYGEALTQAAGGAVTSDAEAVFRQALTMDPKDKASRYFLGLAAVSHGNAAEALQYWNSLLAEAPANSALHADLVDRIAQLRARSGGAAPDIGAMVSALAARLKANPDDPQGWQRLIRAYAVLGDKDRARAALAEARKAAASHGDQLAALATEEKELGL